MFRKKITFSLVFAISSFCLENQIKSSSSAFWLLNIEMPPKLVLKKALYDWKTFWTTFFLTRLHWSLIDRWNNRKPLSIYIASDFKSELIFLLLNLQQIMQQFLNAILLLAIKASVDSGFTPKSIEFPLSFNKQSTEKFQNEIELYLFVINHCSIGICELDISFTNTSWNDFK